MKGGSNDDIKKFGFNTRAIHAGQSPDPRTGAVIPPIYATSTYAQESPGVHKGFEYSRTHNPTRFAYEECIASLEGGAKGFAFSSGLAATATVLDLIDSGSHVIAGDDMYGGTFRLFDKVRKRSAGLQFSYIDLSDSNDLESRLLQVLRDNTRMLWVETPTNPMLKLADLERISQFARTRNIILVCDNTFCSPYLQQPLSLGCDLVVHSATKYINGHSDVVGGVVVARDNTKELMSRLQFLQNAVGSVPSPFDSFLIQRGMKTLGIRMKAHCETALAIAQRLEQHAKVRRVIYPGLESHPQFSLAQRQMRGGGGMITILLNGGIAEARRFLERVQVFTLAESLGGVESLIEHPAIMTHASIPLETRTQLGIDDSLVRISCGIEDVDDLLKDLEQALQ
jgi:cystathionine gamma-lyase